MTDAYSTNITLGPSSPDMSGMASAFAYAKKIGLNGAFLVSVQMENTNYYEGGNQSKSSTKSTLDKKTFKKLPGLLVASLNN